MKRVLIPALVVVTALAIAAAAVAAAVVVPLSAQTRIRAIAPVEAAVPTRTEFDYLYRTWSFNKTTRTLEIRFAHKNYKNGSHNLYFTVKPLGKPLSACSAGNVKMQQMSGNRIYTSPGQAWRCLTSHGVVLKLEAAGPHLPDTGLGYVVASAKLLR